MSDLLTPDELIQELELAKKLLYHYHTNTRIVVTIAQQGSTEQLTKALFKLRDLVQMASTFELVQSLSAASSQIPEQIVGNRFEMLELRDL